MAEDVLRLAGDGIQGLKAGGRGTVNSINDAGTVFISWDCDSGLGMVFGVDIIRRLDD